MVRHAGRRLGVHHFAFYRAYLEGDRALDLAAMADRYLALGSDPRRAAAALRWLQEELAVAARRVGDNAAARLLRLPKSATAAPEEDEAAGRPTLEAFRALHDPDDFYSEAELVALYEAQCPAQAGREAQRNARLRRRRLEALQRLERVAVETPRPDHDLAGWLDPATARRLGAVGIVTLGELIAVINTNGFRWWTRVPRLGPVAAARIARWLGEHAGSLGRAVNARGLAPLRSLAPAALLDDRAGGGPIAPLETVRLPTALDGAAGTNRAPPERNQTGASNDLEAIRAWLAMHRHAPHTWRSYRTQAERLLLWAVYVQGKPLSSLNVADIAQYRRFLAAPEPAAQWIGPRTTARWSARWRPFAGPLSVSSRATACVVLKALFGWLVDMRYLDFNPFSGARPPQEEKQSRRLKTGRSFSADDWAFLMAFANSLPAGDLAAERTRFMLMLAYATGLRLSEMASATLGGFASRFVDAQLGVAWTLRVVGKGKLEREVPAPRRLMAALARYLDARGLSADPVACAPNTPLLGRLAGEAMTALTSKSVAFMFKRFFEAAAARRRLDDPYGAARLARGSAHWLRHTYGTHAIAAGTPLDIVQDNLGHQSPATTSMYLTTEIDRRIRAMETFLS